MAGEFILLRRWKRTRIIRHTPESAPPPRSFWRHFWDESYKKAILPMAAIMVLVVLLDHLGWLQAMERASLDILARGRSHEVASEIFLIEITDNDYNKFFDGISPLDPKIIVDLVRRIREARPSVIGVDLDTRDREWRNQKIDDLIGTNSDVIWAQVPNEQASPGGQEPVLTLQPVLGRWLSDLGGVALPRFPIDPDGVVRRYHGSYPVTRPVATATEQEKSPQQAPPIRLQSLPRAISNKYRKAALPDQEVYFNFSGDRYKFRTVQAGEFLQKDEQDCEVVVKPLSEPQKKLLSGQIVLIGGGFAAARDEYLTPLGPMAGVELIANAVESDLQGGGIRPFNPYLRGAVDWTLGSVVVLLYFIFSVRRGRPGLALASSIGVMLALFLASVFLFYNRTGWLSFVPIMLGMILDQLYDSSHKMRGDLAEARAKVEKLHGELQHSRAIAENLQKRAEQSHSEAEQARLEAARAQQQADDLREQNKKLEQERLARRHHA